MTTVTIVEETVEVTAVEEAPAIEVHAAGTPSDSQLGSGTANSTTFLRGDRTWAVPAGGGGSGEALEQATTQTSHGLAVGDLVRFNGTAYVEAQADSAANAEVVGIVSAVAGANSFTLLTGGNVMGLSGLTAGSVYFLSASSAGALTSTEPATVGQVSKPVLVATATTGGLFINLRGIVIGADVATQAELDAHVNDTADAHDATAISFAPAGTIAATTVQAAIEEVASEAGGGGGGGAFDALVVKAADESVTNSSTLQSDDELFFAIGSSATEVWFFEMFLWVECSDANTEFDCAFIGPAAATARLGGGSGTGTSAFSGFAQMGGGTAPSSLQGFSGTEMRFPTIASGILGYQLQGWVMGGGTAGNVTLQWAQGSATPGVALTVKEHSFLRALKVVS